MLFSLANCIPTRTSSAVSTLICIELSETVAANEIVKLNARSSPKYCRVHIQSGPGQFRHQSCSCSREDTEPQSTGKSPIVSEFENRGDPSCTLWDTVNTNKTEGSLQRPTFIEIHGLCFDAGSFVVFKTDLSKRLSSNQFIPQNVLQRLPVRLSHYNLAEHCCSNERREFPNHVCRD